jgi:hypothetical protein
MRDILRSDNIRDFELLLQFSHLLVDNIVYDLDTVKKNASDHKGWGIYESLNDIFWDAQVVAGVLEQIVAQSHQQ